MLGKLIKNEFKGTSHLLLNIYFATAVVIALMAVAYMLKFTWLSTLCTLALMLISFLVLILTTVGVITSFHKTLYGPQGYLSFTLPVSSGSLLAAKAIVSFVWVLLSYVVCIGIWVGIGTYLSRVIGDETMDMVRSLIEMFKALPDKTVVIKFLLTAAVAIFLTVASLIAKIYFSITVSNTKKFQNLGPFFAIVIFFVVYITIAIVSVILTNYIPLKMVLTSEGFFFTTDVPTDILLSFGISGMVLELVMLVVLFIATAKLMKNKINVK